MNIINLKFTRDYTQIIKGIAIIFMMILHVGGSGAAYDVAFSYHLWYLPAYVYVLVIAFFIDKYNLWKVSLYAIIPLLLIGVFIRYSIADICPNEIQYYCNAYFCGLPYFLVGGLIKITPPVVSMYAG